MALQPEIISKVKESTFTDEWYDIASLDHFWMQWRFKVFKKLLKKTNISENDRISVLEIGCGQGIFLKQLEDNTNWKTDGVDISFQALNSSFVSKSRLYYYDILEKKEIFKEKYDIVFLFDVLEHIENTQEFLEDCLYYLRPGGLFFINVPALQSMHSRYDTIMGHLKRYNKNEIHNISANLKLTQYRLRYWGMMMLPLLFLRKLMMSKKLDQTKIVKKGFQPPNSMVHSLLKLIMNLETFLIDNPLIGTSLMVCATKETATTRD
jgi:2-polyprenyl-3-methyl-5-hydroxy-6-metoxy-1,4-benzoquinol methylase